jgi:GNAT superfamily N-acetyltransferase
MKITYGLNFQFRIIIIIAILCCNIFAFSLHVKKSYFDHITSKESETQLQLNPNNNALKDYEWNERLELEAKDGRSLLHFELRSTDDMKRVIAKVGIRPVAASSTSMDKLIKEIYHITDRKAFQICVLVYMWVDPIFRAQNIGIKLIERAKDYCNIHNYEYILLVHDDNGSGKLIDYYRKNGFIDIFPKLDKGMILKI